MFADLICNCNLVLIRSSGCMMQTSMKPSMIFRIMQNSLLLPSEHWNCEPAAKARFCGNHFWEYFQQKLPLEHKNLLNFHCLLRRCQVERWKSPADPPAAVCMHACSRNPLWRFLSAILIESLYDQSPWLANADSCVNNFKFQSQMLHVYDSTYIFE